MAKRKPRKKQEKEPLKPGEIRIEACYVGHLRDKQKLDGRKNKMAWPRGKAEKWRAEPELIPDEYWYTPVMESSEGVQGGEKVSRKVFKKVSSIREEALEKGWLEPWLFTRKFWNRHPATCENLPGLVVCLSDDDEIVEVTEAYIAIKKVGGHISKFYMPREADKIREYERRIAAGESVDELLGKKKRDIALPKPKENVEPRKKDVTAPKTSVKDRFKKPEERQDKGNRRVRKTKENEKKKAKGVSADESGPEERSLF